VQAAAAYATVLVVLNQAGAVKHAQVLGHCRQRHAEGLRQLAHRCFAQRQARQDGAACGVSERAKGGVESDRLRILNHMV